MGCSNSGTINEIKNKEEEKQETTINEFNTHIQNEQQIKILSEMLVGEHKGNFFYFYILTKTIGEGSFGKVYKVRQRSTNKLFAMKLVKKDNKFQDGKKDFLNEIYILRKLDHPNILKIFEFFTDKKYFYFIMDYLSGGDLYSHIIKLEHYTEVLAAKIMRQLFSCVSYLHKMNIVHRDLKPENMMVSYYNEKEQEIEIKLIDFGTACFYKGDKKLTLKVGSPFYIAPEVIKGSYGFEYDVWSCGIILYILLSGLPPFQGKNNKETFKLIEECNLTFNSHKWKKISSEAIDLVKKCLEKDVNKRIKAIDALRHPFILNNINIKGSLIDKKLSLKNSLQNFTSKQKLKQAAVAFIVHQISNTKITQELKKIFNQLDNTGDGLLTKEDLKKGYKKFFTDDINDEDFDEIMKLIDQDDSGEISIEEFLRATIDYENIATEKNLKYAFDYFDKDGSGTLEPEEIRDILGLADNEKSNKIINNIIKEIDSNGDGLIDYEEFKTIMKKNKEILLENKKDENIEDEIE